MYEFLPKNADVMRLVEEVENRYCNVASGERAYITHLEVAQILGYTFYVENVKTIENAVMNSLYDISTLHKPYPDRNLYNDLVSFINSTVNRKLFERNSPGLTRKHAFTKEISDRMDFATGSIAECMAIKLRSNTSYLGARIKMSEEERRGCLDGEWYYHNMSEKDFKREMNNSLNKFFGYGKWEGKVPSFDELLGIKTRKKVVATNPATANTTAKAPIVGTIAEGYDKLLKDYNTLKDDYAKQEQKYNDKIKELKDKLAETEMNLNSADAEIDRLKAHIASISVPTVTESEEVASLKRKLDLIKGILEF